MELIGFDNTQGDYGMGEYQGCMVRWPRAWKKSESFP